METLREHPVILLSCCMGLSLFLHALNFFSSPFYFMADAPGYLNGAVTLARDWTLRVPPRRGPGMALLLAPVLKLAGEGPAGIWGIKILYHALGLGCVALAFGAGRALAGRTFVAFACGLACAMALDFVYWSNMLSSEVPNAFFCMLFCFLLLRYVRGGGLFFLYTGLGAASFAVLVRPENLVCALAVLPALAWAGKGPARRRNLKHAALALVLASAPLLIWSFRNLDRHGFFGLSNYAGEFLYHGVILEGDVEGIAVKDADSPSVHFIDAILAKHGVHTLGQDVYCVTAALRRFSGLDEMAIMRIMGAAAKDSIRAHPFRAVELAARKLMKGIRQPAFDQYWTHALAKEPPMLDLVGGIGEYYDSQEYPIRYADERRVMPSWVRAQRDINGLYLRVVGSGAFRVIWLLPLAGFLLLPFLKPRLPWAVLACIVFVKGLMPVTVGAGLPRFFAPGVFLYLVFGISAFMESGMALREKLDGVIRRVPPGVWIAAASIVVAGVLAYSNTFSAPFVFDDLPNIVENPSVKSLWPPWSPFVQAVEGGLGARPVAHFSFALDWALGAGSTWSFHATNLAIHLVAALALFGLVRRTLGSAKLSATFGKDATWIAALAALLWTVHPLDTASVTSIIQRCESLSGMFFLLSLYLAARGFGSDRPVPWHAAAVVACFLGAGAKTTIVSLPFVALAYDLMFVHANTKEALARSKVLYAGYGAGVVFAVLLAAMGGTLGEPLVRVPAWKYLITQPEVILHYLGLALWPQSLCLDYLWPVAGSGSAALSAVVVLALVAASAWAFFTRRPLGFLGVWFFLILAPSSSVIPLADIAFEHRMYLPLAAVCVLAVAGAYALGRAVGPRFGAVKGSTARVAGVAIAVFLVVALALATFVRNRDYASEVSIWKDTAQKRPANFRAVMNLGVALDRAGKPGEALPYLAKALRMRPDYPPAYFNLANTLVETSKISEAVALYQEALKLSPGFLGARQNLADVFMKQGKPDLAMAEYMKAIRQDPGFYPALCGIGNILLKTGNAPQARQYFERALEKAPDAPLVQVCMGQVMVALGQPERAAYHFEKVLAAMPDSAQAHVDMADSLVMMDRPMEAVDHYQKALALAPGFALAHNNLGVIMLRLGKMDEGINQLTQAVLISPGYFDAHASLGSAFLLLGRVDEAILHFRQALAIRPGHPQAAQALEAALKKKEQMKKS